MTVMTGGHGAAPSADQLRRIVELACLAPSVHNTQPWRWASRPGGVELHADRTRQLRAEDPDGRNLMISCGGAVDHFLVAAGALGWQPEVDRFPAGVDSSLVATFRLHRANVSATAEADLGALRDRCTDRRRFTSWPVPEQRLADLAGTARSRGGRAQPILDVGKRFRLELAVIHALTIREDSLEATAEQDRWTDRGPHEGVPSEVVPAETAAQGRRSRFGTGLLEDTRRDVAPNDGLIILGGDTDDAPAWLRTGEALSALWLRATRDSLSVVPLSLPIELDETRAEVRDTVLDGEMDPHLLVRIGWQAIGRSELPRTPRRPVAEVLSGI